MGAKMTSKSSGTAQVGDWTVVRDEGFTPSDVRQASTVLPVLESLLELSMPGFSHEDCMLLGPWDAIDLLQSQCHVTCSFPAICRAYT